jgi:hypothetical protein
VVADFICGTSFFLFVFYILKLNSNVKSILMTNLFLKPALFKIRRCSEKVCFGSLMVLDLFTFFCAGQC